MKKSTKLKKNKGIPTLGFLIAWATGNLDKYYGKNKDKNDNTNTTGIWLVVFLAGYILLVIAAFICGMIKVWRM